MLGDAEGGGEDGAVGAEGGADGGGAAADPFGHVPGGVELGDGQEQEERLGFEAGDGVAGAAGLVEQAGEGLQDTPTASPQRSLTSANPSRSARIIDTGPIPTRARPVSERRRSSAARRLARPVRESVRTAERRLTSASRSSSLSDLVRRASPRRVTMSGSATTTSSPSPPPGTEESSPGRNSTGMATVAGSRWRLAYSS
jgi:hypothetical protein